MKPTEKQVEYAKYLAQRMGVELPEENTKQAYSDFYNTEYILKDVIFEYWNEGHSWEDFWEYDFTWQ